MNNPYYFPFKNELIDKLPPVRSMESYYESFEKSPYIAPEDRAKSPEERMLLVSNLNDYRIAREFGYLVDWRIAEALRKGYRLSREKSVASKLYGENEYYKKKEGDTTAFVLLGPSGIGKTTVINASLDYYEQVITHRGKDFVAKQVVYIKVECPPAGSIKTFYDNCIEEMEKALDYELPDKKRCHTADQKGQLFRNCAIRWNLGLLIIDEIQNLLATQNRNLMNQFLTLTNQLSIPIIYVGTDKAVDYFLFSEFLTKRRLGVEIHARTYEKGSLWNNLLEDLWQYQWMKEYVPLTASLNDVFFEETGGIINRVVELFANAQREAIRTGRDTKEYFQADFIRHVSKEYYSMSRDSLNTLANSDAPSYTVKEADLQQTIRLSNRKNTGSNVITKELEENKQYLVDGNRTSQKSEKDDLRKHVLDNVLSVTKYLPYSFTKKEIETVFKQVSSDKKQIAKGEEVVSKKVLEILLKDKQEVHNHKGKECTSVIFEELPRFQGVI